MPFFSYWFWPNPGGWYYDDPRVLAIMGMCVALVVVSIVIRLWRRKLKNPITRALSKSWSGASLWFGVIGLILVASRVEMIQFLAMRAAWILWLLCLGLYVAFQFLQFRRRHYTVLERTAVVDEREKYLPRKR